LLAIQFIELYYKR